MNKTGDKIKQAAALKYSPGENNAPVIVALGKGETADNMVKIAKENKVPVHEDEGLAQTLGKMRIGDEIPPDLYEVVAEILVFISQMDKSYGEKYGIR
jgi:flagellar biosynthesis protein